MTEGEAVEYVPRSGRLRQRHYREYEDKREVKVKVTGLAPGVTWKGNLEMYIGDVLVVLKERLCVN